MGLRTVERGGEKGKRGMMGGGEMEVRRGGERGSEGRGEGERGSEGRGERGSEGRGRGGVRGGGRDRSEGEKGRRDIRTSLNRVSLHAVCTYVCMYIHTCVHTYCMYVQLRYGTHSVVQCIRMYANSALYVKVCAC